MGKNSKIEWTHHTFNCWWGCFKVAGRGECANCYAGQLDKRLGGKHWGVHAPLKYFGDKHWQQPLHWNKGAAKAGERHRVFCASVADVFDNRADPDVRARLWALIKATPNLDWIIVTKRIGNAAKMLPPDWGDGYPNVWLVITAGTQAAVDRDVPKLLQIPAIVHGISCEPMLELINVRPYLDRWRCTECRNVYSRDQLGSRNGRLACSRCLNRGIYDTLNKMPSLTWVICGGEAGKQADDEFGVPIRPRHPEWAHSLFLQCRGVGTAFFEKQHGDWLPVETPASEIQESEEVSGKSTMIGDQYFRRVGKKAAGRIEEIAKFNSYPR